jgi:hypothetical protein
MNLLFFRNKDFLIHLIYWIVLVLFFTIVWGTYDHDYTRNLMVQLWSLPARLLLVYGTLYYLFPKFFLTEQYWKFIMAFIGLLLFASAGIQRAVMLFIVQERYLPYQSEDYFRITELMNTALDVNLALILPFAYVLYTKWKQSQQKSEALEKKNQELQDHQNDFVNLKKGKSFLKVFTKDILFIESLKNYIRVKTIDQEIVCYHSISQMEKTLSEKQFLRVHRSFIISLDHITSFSPTQIDVKGIIIPVGRKYKEVV